MSKLGAQTLCFLVCKPFMKTASLYSTQPNRYWSHVHPLSVFVNGGPHHLVYGSENDGTGKTTKIIREPMGTLVPLVTFFERGILIAIMKKHHLPHISMTFLGHTAAISSVSSGCSKLYCNMSMVILSTVGIQGRWMNRAIPSGKRLHNYGKSPFLMGKSTISMARFNSYDSHYQRVVMTIGHKFCAQFKQHSIVKSAQAISMAGWNGSWYR